MALTSTAATRRLAGILLASGALMIAVPAEAQLMNNMAGARRETGADAAKPEKTEPPIPAIPGERPSAPVAPALRPALDMSPTEALFDAINRGDLAAARDAINRGADLNGKDVLGESPLELSVDLGRNDISFLLLSMRRVIGTDQPQNVALGAGPPAPPQRGRRHQHQLRAAELETSSAAAPVSLGGGTPVPAAGFLGFDFGHSADR